GKVVDEVVVFALCNVVEILDADDVGDLLRFLELPGSDVAKADVANQSLALEIGKHSDLFLDGAFDGRGDSTDAQVHDVETIEAEIAEIVLCAVDELLARKGRDPGFIFAATSAEFGYDGQFLRVGMKGLLDDLVGDVRAVEVAGVDVIYASGDGFTQHCDCA